MIKIPEHIIEEMPKTVVCVTDQKRCDRIIKTGRLLANLSGTPLAVINVAKVGAPQDPESIEYLFKVTKENNAEMTLLYSDDVAKAIIRYLKSNKTSYVLTGIPTAENSVITKIWKKFTHISFFVVGEAAELIEVQNPARVAQNLKLKPAFAFN